jgi:Tfp pilus assembly protein FimT
MLVVGISILIVMVAIPSLGGWILQRNFRMKVQDLIESVRSAKIHADQTREAQTVILTRNVDGVKTPKNVFLVRRDSNDEWTITHYGGRVDKSPEPKILVDASGHVEPVKVRVSDGTHYIEYEFDFLTGFAREVGYSF